MTDDRSDVLVACASEWDAPARLPRLLRDAGCRVTVMCPSNAAIARTRYVDAIVTAGPSPADFVRELREHLARATYDWVIAVDDPLLDELSRTEPAAWMTPCLPIDCDRVPVDLLASKAAFVDLAARAGLPVPRSIVCRRPEEAARAALEIGLPVVVKRARSFAGMGVRRIDDARDVESVCKAQCDGSPVVVQAFVEGQLGNTAALFQRGRPLGWISAYKARTWPGTFGPSCARQLAEPQEVESIVCALGAYLGYHGFCAVDWIVEAHTGRLVLLELNARPVPAIHLAAADGVDFARGVRALVRGEPLEPMRPRAVRPDEPVVSLFPQDFFRAITENDTLALRQWRDGERRFDDVPWDDPPLLEHFLRRRLTRRRFEETFGRRTRDGERECRATV